MKRAQADIEFPVSFLMRRVSKSDIDDWKKLKRVMSFLKRTSGDICMIGDNNLFEIFTWVDAAFAVHDNMRSHIGGAMSLGHGILHGKLAMEKLNTKSSTEAEILGVSEYIPYNLWLLMFYKNMVTK